MATRSAIGIEKDGKILAVTCHWDGYLENNGEILYRHYQNPVKTLELISLGHMSTLGAEIGEKHDFDDRSHTNWTTYYGRDRGEEDTEFSVVTTPDQMISWYDDCDYYYLYTQGRWIYSQGRGWKDLKDAIESIDAERAE